MRRKTDLDRFPGVGGGGKERGGGGKRNQTFLSDKKRGSIPYLEKSENAERTKKRNVAIPTGEGRVLRVTT